MSAIAYKAAPHGNTGIGNTTKLHHEYIMTGNELLVNSILSFLFGSWLAAIIVAAYTICKWVAGFGVV